MRIDAERLKRDTDLLALISHDVVLKRKASTKGGEFAGPCPFCLTGDDRFRVWPDAEKPGFWCRVCEKSGSAIDYVMQREGLDFRAACERLDAGIKSVSVRLVPRPKEAKTKIPDCEDLHTRAVALMVDCAAALWEPGGASARAWLNERGLADETLKANLIGFNGVASWRNGFRVARGITIPHWQESTNTLSGIKLRLSVPKKSRMDKYTSVAGSTSSLYLADNLPRRDVAVICEGEFDALLLAQEVGDLVGVCALGSATNYTRAVNAGLPFLLHVKRLLVATDNDQDGETAAAHLLERTKRAKRLRPPKGNDVSDSWREGVDLRAWVENALLVEELEARHDRDSNWRL